MASYLALLRGINVGGNNKLPMADLKQALITDGFASVRTYIQSGNVLFTSEEKVTDKLAKRIEQSIKTHFNMVVPTAVFSAQEWQGIIDKAPRQWGKDPAWKHNLLILLKPYDMQEVIAAVGTLKPDIEFMVPGDGVLYQSMSLALFGRTTTGKLASNPIYRRMTIRNYNTSLKLLKLLTS
jgi:uncharacterized protein (DUF1697 family)